MPCVINMSLATKLYAATTVASAVEASVTMAMGKIILNFQYLIFLTNYRDSHCLPLCFRGSLSAYYDNL